MTTSNLAILVLITAIALFITSKIVRRSQAVNPAWLTVVKVLRIVVLALAALYFYKRFVG